MDEQKTKTLDYFESVSSEYLDRYYQEGTGRYPNLRLRAEIVRRTISALVPAKAKVLDAGCGGGNLAVDLAIMGYEVVGMDIAPGMVESGRKLAAERAGAITGKVSFQAGDIENLPFGDGEFAAMVASGVFEYLEQDGPALAQIRRVLAPGGVALVSFRNRAFNLFSANQYTKEELKNGGLAALLDEVGQSLPEDAAGLTQRAAGFQTALKQALQQPVAPAPPAPPKDEARWEKRMPRRQHTVAQVRKGAEAAGLELNEALFFHFHPFPPAVRDSFPGLYDALGLALENFADTALGELMASSFVALLRVK